MSKTANNSLAQILKAEEQKEEMITQAINASNEKIRKKKEILQAKFDEEEKLYKEKAQLELDTQKESITHKYKDALHEAEKEAQALKGSLGSKLDLAVTQGVQIVTSAL